MSLIVEKIRKKDAFDSREPPHFVPRRGRARRRSGGAVITNDTLIRFSAAASPAAWRCSRGRRAPGLFELNHGPLDMLTHRTFKGPKVVPRLLRLNARQIHLRRACWALGSYDNRRVCKRVFGKRHLKLPF